MERNTEHKRVAQTPSALSAVVWCVLLVALGFQVVMMLADGEYLLAGSLLLWSTLALLALRALHRKREQLFAWPVLGKLLATLMGMSGALGMLIETVNLGVSVTYFADVPWWAGPMSLLCLVLTFFLPAVVVLIWMTPRR